MPNGKIERSIVVAGFTTLAIILSIEGVAVTKIYDGHPVFQERPQSMMGLLFSRAR